jgi:A/G-specific adenine glycosylase
MPEFSSVSILKSSANALEHWYERNKRNMPWRLTKEPYNIWLSEIILQQTRVEQGLPYYLAFLEAFPTVHDLAKAEEDTVLRVWQGLGYYNRARNLHKTAKIISKENNGVFPLSYDSLLLLPGIGPYTAAAISSICYEEEVPVIDGNVQRLISRHFLVEELIDSGAGSKALRSIAESWIQGRTPSRFNQAMMELGALICSPKSPSCETCPLNETCLALREDKVLELPKKKAKKAIRERHLIYHVHRFKGKTLLVKRGTDDVWAGLYEWPSEECNATAQQKIKKAFAKKQQFEIKHVLSHQHIHALFILHLEALPKKVEGGQEVGWNSLDDYPMSRLMTRFLELYSS